jgi:hypothetical protein
MTSGKAVTATFRRLYRLTVNGDGVRSSPHGIDCRPTCSARFRSTSLITLSTTPSVSLSWSGACTGGGFSCTLPVDAGTSVGLDRRLVSLPLRITGWALTVTTSRGGRVAIADGTIHCSRREPKGCDHLFRPGTTVRLRATAKRRFKFVRWGGFCSDRKPCRLRMNGAKTVLAVFKKK